MASDLLLATPLADAELERLETLLAAERNAMRLDGLHGLCAAMAMGPDAEIANRWLDVALGQPESDATPAELLRLLERFRAATEDAVNDRSLVIRPRETRTGRVDFTGWCRGFLAGVRISETDWFDAADPEELADLLFPIEVLADALPHRVRATYKPDAWRRQMRKAEDALAPAIGHLADYWAILRAPPLPVRRAQPKVGRNDPCPCGSGKKFKQCHGKGAAPA
jgi:uncharacterized protein